MEGVREASLMQQVEEKGRGTSNGRGHSSLFQRALGRRNQETLEVAESHRLFYHPTVVEKEEGKETKKYQHYF